MRYNNHSFCNLMGIEKFKRLSFYNKRTINDYFVIERNIS